MNSMLMNFFLHLLFFFSLIRFEGLNYIQFAFYINILRIYFIFINEILSIGISFFSKKKIQILSHFRTFSETNLPKRVFITLGSDV